MGPPPLEGLIISLASRSIKITVLDGHEGEDPNPCLCCSIVHNTVDTDMWMKLMDPLISYLIQSPSSSAMAVP